jgi:citrate synthase
MNGESWNTAITKIEPNKILVRGYRVNELMGKVSFPQMVYLLIKGEMPSENVGQMIEAILVSSVDHGVTMQRSLPEFWPSTNFMAEPLNNACEP